MEKMCTSRDLEDMDTGTCLLADEDDLWRGGRADDAEKGRGQERMALEHTRRAWLLSFVYAQGDVSRELAWRVLRWRDEVCMTWLLLSQGNVK